MALFPAEGDLCHPAVLALAVVDAADAAGIGLWQEVGADLLDVSAADDMDVLSDVPLAAAAGGVAGLQIALTDVKLFTAGAAAVPVVFALVLSRVGQHGQIVKDGALIVFSRRVA